MQLETERLLLRLPRLDDAEAAGELLGDPEVMRFIGGTVPSEQWRDVMQMWVDRWEANGLGPFMLVRRADGRLLGRTGIMIWDRRDWAQSHFADAGEHAQLELGWALARSAWGNGYVTEAARAVLDWLRAERDVPDLVSVISPENTPSQGVARRLGATPGELVELLRFGPAVVWRYAA
jgi:RimJ/RimL family protein N-acetyltransferase